LWTWKTVAAVVALALIAVASFATYEVYLAGPPASCQIVRGGSILRSQASEVTFGAVSEYNLPSPGRWPNAIANASDGSVWVAEQELPGVAHLIPGNRTLVEYAWPGYPSPELPDCSPTVSVSGMAIWNGRVWAADEFDNRTIGLNPRDGTVISVNSTSGAPFPYWLAVGPDGDLWVTSNNLPGEPTRLGRILPDLTLQVINLVGLGNDQPIQLDFVNSTFALLATVNQSQDRTGACVCTGDIYSFDPSSVGSSLTPVLVGGGYHLTLPTSVSYSSGSLWVTQHGASSVVRYDFATRAWTTYPTSIVPWTDITLPLVVDASGDAVWFNEHEANKIAMLNPSAGTLTEYSESNPPPSSYQGVQNDLSIALATDGLWFTSMSGNYVGHADGTSQPGFVISAAGNNAATIPPGGNATFDLRVSGTWSTSMGVNVSDSENVRSVPTSISIAPSSIVIPPNSSPYELGVKVSVSGTTSPGSYTLAVTVTNGPVQQTAYLFITVK
jgi:streptogramin lyase